MNTASPSHTPSPALRKLCLVAIVAAFLPACSSGGGSGSGTTNTTLNTGSTIYNGSASVGDFLQITIDRSGKTIAYNNLTNSDSGTVSYSIDTDNSYLITDPTGNMVRGWEIPGLALVLQSTKSGPSMNTPALISAVTTENISAATLQGRTFNYLQFRTKEGGLEVGAAVFDGTGNLDLKSYTPRRVIDGGSPFDNNNRMAASDFSVDTSGKYISIVDGSETSIMFATTGGFLVVDTSIGTVIAMEQAASKSFNSSFAGTYKAIVYQKTGCTTVGSDEGGSAEMLKGTITIAANGNVTIVDADDGHTVVSNQPVVPLEDDSDFYDGTTNKIDNTCHGMFTLDIDNGDGSGQELFITFLDNNGNQAMLIGSFMPGQTGTNSYDYLYGFAIKTSNQITAEIQPRGIANIAQ